MATHFVQSKAKTGKLHCTDCNKRIKKGEQVVFELDDCMTHPMVAAYGECCLDDYQMQVASERHPFDLEY